MVYNKGYCTSPMRYYLMKIYGNSIALHTSFVNVKYIFVRKKRKTFILLL